MKVKVITVILICLAPVHLLAQKTGIVSEINPKMGYVHLKGVIKTKVLGENDLDFNVLSYLASYFSDKHIETEQPQDFDFSRLEYFSERHKYKDMLAYAEVFCEKNNLNQLIIIRRKNAYTIADPMQMFYGFDHDYGIATLSLYDKRPILFYNFSLIRYLKGSKNFDVLLQPSYKNQKFDEVVFDKEKNTLINDKVFPYFKPVFEGVLSKALTKIEN